jgi:hypothetical protein
MNATSPQLIPFDRIKMIIDPARIEREYQAYLKGGDGYIDRRFTDLRDWDFPVYCAVNITITTKDGRAVPFLLNKIQLRLVEIILEELTAMRAVRILIDKIRQGGVSTVILIFFYWLTSLRENRNTLVITQDLESVTNFSSRIRAAIEEADPLLTPNIKSERNNLIHFANPTARGGNRRERKGKGLDSKMMFFTCKKVSIGRSFTFQYVHISEAAFYLDQKPKVSVKTLLSSLAHAVPLLPGSILIIETTPNGLNEIAEMWDKAIKKQNEFRPVFFPAVASEEYRAPLPEGETLELCEAEEASGVPTMYGNELAESKVIRKQLVEWYPDLYEKWGDKWLERELLARLNWRRHYIAGPCHGDKAIFRREFPLTPQQGFEATGRNCFDLRSVALMRKLVEEEGVQPRRYSYIHDPENTDPSSKFKADDYGALAVYELPQMGVQYVLSADPALGNPNSDPSALLVLAVSEESPYLREVASYSKITKPDVFAELVYYLGTLYGTALVAPERNERGGFVVCLKLHKDLEYERLYFEFNAYDKKPSEEPGFVTKDSNKATIVAGLDYRIRDAEILLRTPMLLEQLEHFVELENGDLGAEPGYNDDLAMCAMIGVNVSLKVHYYIPKPTPPPGSIGDLKKRGVFKRNR